MDLVTIGGIIGVVVIVIATCAVIFKLLSRETTFEEAYGDNALKLLNNQQNGERVNKKDKHKHKPKRRQSPKDETTQSKKVLEKAMVQKLKEPMEEKEAEPEPLLVKKVEVPVQKEKSNEGSKRKEKSKTPNNLEQQEAEQMKKEEKLVEEKLNEGEVKAKEIVVAEGTASSKTEVVQPPVEKKTSEEQQHSSKKVKKQVSLKDISMPKLIDRLKEIGELEPEFIMYLHNSMDEVKAKENKLRSEVKEIKNEKGESDKKLKQAIAELEGLRAETSKIMKEKKDQNERHVVFEQTVRQKLVETMQLKDENKKLTEQLQQANSKLAQAEHFVQKANIMQSELIKAREECAMSKKYAEAKAAETAQLKQDAEEALRSARSNFEGRLQATHAELNKEREQRIGMDKERQMAKQMMDKLIADMANTENRAKETALSKTAYENKIQALQNELNREKDHHMQVTQNAQAQISELTSELDKAMMAYSNMVQQQNSESAKFGEMNSRNKQLEEEIDRLKAQVQSAAKADEVQVTVADLTKQLNDQKTRNQDLREANYKLMDSIKHLQSTQHSLTNGGTNDNTGCKDIPAGKLAQLERLVMENRNYKITLDSVNNQLEKVSRIAEEMEREKDANIAKLEERLAVYEKEAVY